MSLDILNNSLTIGSHTFTRFVRLKLVGSRINWVIISGLLFENNSLLSKFTLVEHIASSSSSHRQNSWPQYGKLFPPPDGKDDILDFLGLSGQTFSGRLSSPRIRILNGALTFSLLLW